jgi:hypothetical protein
MAVKMHKSLMHKSQMHKSRKHLSRKTKHNSRKNSRKNKNQKNHKKQLPNKSKKNYSKNHNRRMQRQKGGSTNCNLASVKEPGFNIAGLGDIPGLSIPDSRGAIYRPNCKPDSYQAMTP